MASAQGGNVRGTIKNYRRSVKSQRVQQVIVEVEGINSKAETAKVLGKGVVWKTASGKRMKGKIIAPHGAKGAVRARFVPALPGQAIGKRVTVC